MDAQQLLAQAHKVADKLPELNRQLEDPNLYNDRQRAAQVNKEHAFVYRVSQMAAKMAELLEQRDELTELANGDADKSVAELAHEELRELDEQERQACMELRLLLLPSDPLDEKSCIVEIRAGTGGDEASLFAADLYRMYSYYADAMGWRTEHLSENQTGVGGYKEIVFSVVTPGAYSKLKYESGVHRVQRVPTTESSGRLHTSAVTVAVLPEAEESDIEIRSEDLRIDVYRSSGPGGQSVNTTDSAVRITHLPTGVVVICQDEKSQHKNRDKAMRVLRARLYEEEERKRQQERATERREQVGSGDRSQRIRTYNFPQNRVTDHRINLTLHKLDSMLDGNIQEMIDTLRLSAENTDSQ